MKTFCDESGDIGFSKKSTENFVQTAVTFKDDILVEKKLKKYLKKLLQVDKKRAHYFHAHKETHKVRMKIFKIILEFEFSVNVDIFGKKREVKYVEMMSDFLSNLDKNCSDILVSVLDTRTKTQDEIRSRNKDRKIEFSDSRKNLLLQVVDLISWSIYQYIENEDDTYYDLFKDRIEDKIFIKQNPRAN